MRTWTTKLRRPLTHRFLASKGREITSIDKLLQVRGDYLAIVRSYGFECSYVGEDVRTYRRSGERGIEFQPEQIYMSIHDLIISSVPLLGFSLRKEYWRSGPKMDRKAVADIDVRTRFMRHRNGLYIITNKDLIARMKGVFTDPELRRYKDPHTNGT